MFHSGIGFTAIHIGVDDEVISDDVCRDGCLCDEAVEVKELCVFRLPETGGHHGVAGEYGRFAVGVDRVTRQQNGFLQIVFSDKFENTIMEVEAVASENRDVFWDFGGVRVWIRARGRTRLGLGVGAEGIKRGFDPEAAFSATAFRGGVFWCGK